jgi:hypothetical protein
LAFSHIPIKCLWPCAELSPEVVLSLKAEAAAIAAAAFADAAAMGTPGSDEGPAKVGVPSG